MKKRMTLVVAGTNRRAAWPLRLMRGVKSLLPVTVLDGQSGAHRGTRIRRVAA